MTPTSDMNILFISICGLNDWIEPLGGHPDAKTPNMNRLADRAMVFQSAYAASPASSPSTTAVLFGQNPWETGLLFNDHKWHDYYPGGERKSLIGRFLDQGYETRGAGKLFHNHARDFDACDWSEFHHDKLDKFPPISKIAQSRKLGRIADFGPIGDGDEQYDDRNTEWLLSKLTPKSSGQFWALGLLRPNLPFIVPQVFFDPFRHEVSDPPGLGQSHYSAWNTAVQQQLFPAGRGFANSSKILARQLDIQGEYKDLLRAYLASVTYVDELLGSILDRLEDAGLWDNTLLVLWSDHGWQFGEKLAFRNFSLWERSLRVPLMFAGPGIMAGTSSEPVSLTDIAPTIMARAGIDIPAQFSGQDLSPVLEGRSNQMRGHAVSVWGRGLGSDGPEISKSVRTATHRLISYWDGSEELYDHRVDPFEHRNLILDRETEPQAEIDRLRHNLKKHLDFDPASLV